MWTNEYPDDIDWTLLFNDDGIISIQLQFVPRLTGAPTGVQCSEDMVFLGMGLEDSSSGENDGLGVWYIGPPGGALNKVLTFLHNENDGGIDLQGDVPRSLLLSDIFRDPVEPDYVRQRFMFPPVKWVQVQAGAFVEQGQEFNRGLVFQDGQWIPE